MRDPLEELLERSRREGSWNSSGQFTLDIAKAASRLGQDFAKTYPGEYLLKFVQAGVAFDSKAIEVQLGRRALRLVIHNPQRTSFLDYFRFALERSTNLPDSAPVVPFFQGLWSILYEGGKNARIRISSPEGEAEYLCSDKGIEQCPIQASQARTVKENTLFLEIERPISWKKREMSLLGSRCQYCPCELFVDGKPLKRKAWAELKTSKSESWYDAWAPRGFRLAESYFAGGIESRVSSVHLPGLDTRKARVIGASQDRLPPSAWRPSSKNVFFHQGSHGGFPCGALAQTLDHTTRTPLVVVKHGVTLVPSTAMVHKGGLAVIECHNYGLKTDVFGLRLVEDEQLRQASQKVNAQLKRLRRDLRPILHRFRWPQKRFAIGKIQMGVGGLALLSAPFLPVAATSTGLLVGVSQIAFGAFQSKLSPNKTGKEFAQAVALRFPDLNIQSADPNKQKSKKRYSI